MSVMRWRVDTTYEARLIDDKLVMVRTGTPTLTRLLHPEDAARRTPPHGDPLMPRRLRPITVRDIERARIDIDRVRRGFSPLSPSAHVATEAWMSELPSGDT